MRKSQSSGLKRPGLWLGVACVAAVVVAASAQQQAAGVNVQVEILRQSENNRGASQRADASNVAVWLIPVAGAVAVAPSASSAGTGHSAPKLVQRDKMFSPHVLVVQAGSMVQFPNEDPFFHNVFSLFAGKRFDLGLYEAGSSRAVRFDHPGASFLFCNIHPEMSAVIVVVPTPYYGLSDAAGRVNITAVPDGRYQLKVWHERSSPEDLANLAQIVTVSASARSIGPIRIPDNVNLTLTHKNKYGQDYPSSLTQTTY